MKFSYDELASLKAKCKSDSRTVIEWNHWVEWMIGSPEKYDRFVILDHSCKTGTRGMYLTNNGWCTSFDSARRYDWKETAILITENRKLEAIRFKDGIASTSKGVIVGVE
jgi:hypothetical protein